MVVGVGSKAFGWSAVRHDPYLHRVLHLNFQSQHVGPERDRMCLTADSITGCAARGSAVKIKPEPVASAHSAKSLGDCMLTIPTMVPLGRRAARPSW